jgi:hypothetical protein
MLHSFEVYLANQRITRNIFEILPPFYATTVALPTIIFNFKETKPKV